MKTVALIVAGGSSIRFGGEVPKQYLTLAGKPLLSQTINKFEQSDVIDEIVVVVAEEFLLYTSEKIIDPYGFKKVSKIVIGGESRQESVLNGLKSLSASTTLVAIHDAARPLISQADIKKVVEVAISEKAAILGQKMVNTVKRTTGDFIISTLNREALFMAETPQVFQFDLILEAHKEFEGDNATATDDAYLVEQRGFKVKVVESNSPNFKVTTKADFKLAEYIINEGLDG